MLPFLLILITMSSSVSTLKTIYIVAAVILNQHHELLLVRKRGTTAFMQAGGKIEANETPLLALQRELQEELAVTIAPEQCHYLGHYEAPAANEAGFMVDAYVYQVTLNHPSISAHAELDEVRWCDLQQASQLSLAPLTRDYLLPIVKQQIADSIK